MEVAVIEVYQGAFGFFSVPGVEGELVSIFFILAIFVELDEVPEAIGEVEVFELKRFPSLDGMRSLKDLGIQLRNPLAGK